ncbi:hypothetical protein HMPREF0724_11788 [Prescottella equi ATCC 33707]|uniref:Uncharacterized protein n=1 Tax=Prescottella equi ATCC 33707 TaxID=525370 RepID=E9T087_RHOHA|nr:hypothetical protein HMPREF0724_11788 [Prescottella equi ATCC 33707]
MLLELLVLGGGPGDRLPAPGGDYPRLASITFAILRTTPGEMVLCPSGTDTLAPFGPFQTVWDPTVRSGWNPASRSCFWIFLVGCSAIMRIV